MEEKINLLVSQLGEIRVKKDADIGEYLGENYKGKIGALYIATSVSELIKVVTLCEELNITYLLIGSGSKVFIKDSKLPVLIIKNRSKNLKIFGVKGKVSRSGIGIKEAFVEADSGVTLPDLAAFSESQGLAGFDDLRLSKSTVGGSILSNKILQDKVTQIIVLSNKNTENRKEIQELSSNEVILRVIFHLKAREV
ncbi:MAG: FAD-binding protein [Microgenomates group bacterium]|jgi:UDP-N-acetylenolpyruvoylglucosamine reductase